GGRPGERRRAVRPEARPLHAGRDAVRARCRGRRLLRCEAARPVGRRAGRTRRPGAGRGVKLVVAAVVLLALGGLRCGAEPRAAAPDRPGLFVLGVDGLDPVILERLMAEGRMPHFAALAREGSYRRLGTSNPPQSPVAWSNFVTGRDPGG